MTLTSANRHFTFLGHSDRFGGGHVTGGWYNQNEVQDFCGKDVQVSPLDLSLKACELWAKLWHPAAWDYG